MNLYWPVTDDGNDFADTCNDFGDISSDVFSFYNLAVCNLTLDCIGMSA